MIFLLYGENIDARIRRRDEILGTSTPERFDADTLTPEVMAQCFEVDLFGGERKITFNRVLTDPRTQSFVIEAIHNLNSLSHTYIFIEEKLLKKDLELLKKVDVSIEHFPLTSGRKNTSFSLFPLIDMCAKRDRKNAWLLYCEAIRNNVSPDEILNLLWWQYKTIGLVAKQGGNPGLKPFVYQKAQRFLGQYSNKELSILMSRLVTLHIDARQSDRGLGIGLERFILSL